MSRSAVLLPLVLYALWTAATWFFEGRIGTLLRSSSLADRLVYALGVNVLLGIVGSALLLRTLARQPVASTPNAAASAAGHTR